jgi:hypothetical protein
MIEVIGPEDTSERGAAEKIKAAFVDLWPDLATSNNDRVRIAANAKIYGYDIQDIDIVIVASFGSNRIVNPLRPLPSNPDGEVVRIGIALRSFVLAVELKSHDQRGVRFVGKSAQVRYRRAARDGWHDATEQNIRQAHALKAYLNDYGAKDLYVSCMVMFENLEESDFPTRPHALIGGAFSARSLLTALGETSKPWKPVGWRTAVISAGRTEAVTRALDLPLFRKMEASQLDRQRMDRLAKRLGLRNDWFAAIGKRQVVLRGRGGTGKTVILLQMAFRAFEDANARSLVLTYNQALVADMRRIMALLGLPSNETDGGIRIDTAMAFVGRLLRKFGVVSDQKGFVEQYDDICKQLAELFRSLPNDEVRQLLSDDPEHFRFDYILIDEGQDWMPAEIAILRHCYPAERFVIADGVDQFVRGARVEWTAELSSSEQTVINLHSCLRLKSNLAAFANTMASELHMMRWRIEPNPQVRGGRVIIVEGDYFGHSHFDDAIAKDTLASGNSEIDILYCVPSTPRGPSSKIADWLRARNRRCWDGAVADVRRDIPRSASEARIVTYDSCRGLEGWSVVCVALDEFWARVVRHANDAPGAQDPTLTTEEASRRLVALWTMIPMTRPMDTLVINILDRNSAVGVALSRAARLHSDFVEWLN